MHVHIPEHLKREDEIARDVVSLFTRLGCAVYVTSEPRRRLGTPGMLDLYLILPQFRGVAWFDVKQPGEALSAAQVDFVAAHQRSGIPCGWGAYVDAIGFATDLGLVARI